MGVECKGEVGSTRRRLVSTAMARTWRSVPAEYVERVLPKRNGNEDPDGNSPKRAHSFFKMTIEFLYSRLNSDNFRAFPVRSGGNRRPHRGDPISQSGANAGRFSSRSNDRCRFWPMPTPTRAPDVHLAAAVQSTLTRRAGFGMIAALMNGERFKQASQSAHPRTYEPPNISRGIPRGTKPLSPADKPTGVRPFNGSKPP